MHDQQSYPWPKLRTSSNCRLTGRVLERGYIGVDVERCLLCWQNKRYDYACLDPMVVEFNVGASETSVPLSNMSRRIRQTKTRKRNNRICQLLDYDAVSTIDRNLSLTGLPRAHRVVRRRRTCVVGREGAQTAGRAWGVCAGSRASRRGFFAFSRVVMRE